MARLTIVWKRSAVRELDGLSAEAARRIVAAVGALADEPFPPGVRKLAGAERLWRIRIGDYRVVYDVERERLEVEIVRVAHRREVYRR